MESTWEKVDKNKVKLEIEVDEDKVEQALEQAYRKVVKDVEVPGFRKGKVPRKILESKYGPEIFYEDALEILVPEAYKQAVEENEIEPVAQPEIDIDEMEKGKPLKFNATVEIKPEVQLGTYKGLEVEKERVDITEEDVESELKRMQEEHAEYQQSEEGEAEKGDRVVIDLKGFADDEPLPGGEAQNYNLELGSGQMFSDFEEQLEGVKPGEEKEIKITLPDDYQDENLKGKEVTFSVNVKELKKKHLLPLDDEFAKDVSEFDTLEELKEDIRNRLEEQAEQAADRHVEEQLIRQAVENAEVEIPEPMKDQELDKMVREFEQNLKQQGLDLETYYKLAGTDEESIKEQFREPAENRVKQNLVLETIRDNENITASEEDLEEYVEKMAEETNQDKDKVRELMEQHGYLDNLKDEISIKNTLNFLKEHAEINIVEKAQQEEQQKEEEADQKSPDEASQGENQKE